MSLQFNAGRAGIMPRGDWPQAGGHAFPLDRFRHNNSAYICVSETISEPEPDNPAWMLDIEGIAPGSIRQAALAGDIALYVRPDGSDNNEGLTDSAAGAFKTVQAAIDSLLTYDGRGHNAFIHIAAGDYAAANFGHAASSAAFDTVYLRGTGAASASLTRLMVRSAVQVEASGLTIGGGSTAVGALGFGKITLSDVGVVGASGNTLVANDGSLWIGDGVSISGSHSWVFAVGERGYLHFADGGTTAVAGSCVYFVNAYRGAQVVVRNNGFSGAMTGYKFSVSRNAVIGTEGRGENYFPGSGAGVKDSGGQYT